MADDRDDFAPDPEGISIFDVLDRLEAMVNQSRRLPLTSSIVVGEDEILEALDQIRVSLPDEIREARMVLETREARIREAEEQAEQTLLAAQERADRLTDDHEVTRKATAEADRLVTEARDRSRKMRRDADDYVRDRMSELEAELASALAQVRRGLETLDVGQQGDDKPKRRGRRR
jgi:F0F1-type ATP synthase membrane subunit b/b'